MGVRGLEGMEAWKCPLRVTVSVSIRAVTVTLPHGLSADNLATEL